MSRALLSCRFWAFVLIGSCLATPVARADEFAIVPLNDPLYKHLIHVQRSGWTGAAPDSISQKAQPATAKQELTRYEFALETAKAIFTINTHKRTDATWAANVSRPTLRSLRELTLAMRVELKKLDIDAAEVAKLIDTLLKPVALNTPSLETPVRTAPTRLDSARLAPREPSTMVPSVSGFQTIPNAFELPLSQRLRVRTVLSSLEREARDPLSQSRLSLAQTGAELDVNSWLTLRASRERQLGSRGEFPLLNDADLIRAPEATITGGAIDIAVRDGVKFSGGLARVSPSIGDGKSATRLEGGLGMVGWKNRLVLSANVSRLMPEDSVALTTTAAALNVDLGLTERLSLKLLYQQLFGSQQPRQADRVLAGGITINF